MPKYDAVFVGLTVLDIAGRPVVQVPEGGGVEFVQQIRMNPAGTAAGANLNAAKLGIRTAAVGCLGNDEKADFILSCYRRWGIDCSLMQTSDARDTSATILPIRPNGERPCLHYRGASDELFVTEEEFDRVLDCTYLHHGGTGLLEAMDKGQSARLLAAAKARGVITCFDMIHPNEGTLDLIAPLLPYVDYFMPSLEEAAFIAGSQDPIEVANFFFDLGVKTCVLKDGVRGSYLIKRDSFQRVPAYVLQASDTTGCGDAYCGGFIAGLARGLSEVEACRIGSAVGALVASGLGSDAGVVNWEETMRFMESYGVVE
jgi:sugar/nucleoside kinase (ribokinase family)